MAWLLLCVCALQSANSLASEKFPPLIFPEQRTIQVRDPSELRPAPIPNTPPPPTVSDIDTAEKKPERTLSLDEAIRTALNNTNVVRVLAGTTATSSGRTIYDTAIINNGIDEQQARFDPTLQVTNSFNRIETPQAAFDPIDPTRSVITGTRVDNYNLDVGVAKTMAAGGTLNLGWNADQSRFRPGVFPLNPQTRSSLDLSFTQPLLQGGGWRANMAPIVLARIDTERSYFQFKDSMQEYVRGVIEAYWGVVFARTDVWARRQQVQQANEAYELADGRFRVGVSNIGEPAQAKVALNNFRVNLISAQANLLQREAALRNILGFPPYDSEEIVPTTPPQVDRIVPDWQELLMLASERRPDLIELKLVLEADEQFLLQARNQALPRVDAVALYRWNGLEGEMPIGQDLSSPTGAFADWTLGVNFSVPLGLRQSRASLRRRELLISRDEANLQQGVHNAAHVLAGNMRNLALYYEQYQAFRAVREAARTNLELQLAQYRNGRVIFLNVLQAITDWGNAVSSEAQLLLQYNIELATVERQSGTILETHGVRFFEERYGSIGPLGRLAAPTCYPESLPPAPNFDRYPDGERPAEESFDLRPPTRFGRGVPNPGVQNPAEPNPGVPNPGVPNPGVPNPGVPNPGVPNPGVPNPGVPNPGVPNPAVPNPGLPNPAEPIPAPARSLLPPNAATIPNRGLGEFVQ